MDAQHATDAYIECSWVWQARNSLDTLAAAQLSFRVLSGAWVAEWQSKSTGDTADPAVSITGEQCLCSAVLDKLHLPCITVTQPMGQCHLLLLTTAGYGVRHTAVCRMEYSLQCACLQVNIHSCAVCRSWTCWIYTILTRALGPLCTGCAAWCATMGAIIHH